MTRDSCLDFAISGEERSISCVTEGTSTWTCAWFHERLACPWLPMVGTAALLPTEGSMRWAAEWRCLYRVEPSSGVRRLCEQCNQRQGQGIWARETRVETASSSKYFLNGTWTVMSLACWEQLT